MAHGDGHGEGVFGAGDGGIEQYPIDAQFHGAGDIAGGADAGIDNDREGWVGAFEFFHEDADGVGVQDALA